MTRLTNKAPTCPKTTIEYYILSKRNKNHSAYQGKLERLKSEYGYDGDEGRPFPIGVTVWNEANTVADITIRAVRDLLALYERKEDEILSHDEKVKWERALCGEKVRVWSLGFGANAQAIVKNLYVHTAKMFPTENGFYAANEFRAEVFAPEADTMGAFLSYESPFTIYLPGSVNGPLGTQNIPTSILETAIQTERRKHVLLIKQKTTEILKKSLSNPKRRDWAKRLLADPQKIEKRTDEEYSPLAVSLYKESCVDFDFLEKLDQVTGKDHKRDFPQFLVIATGDDYQNIRLTNALVYDIMREGGGSGKQMIILNLRDERNATLIDSKYLQTEKRTQGAPYSTIKVGKDLIIVIVGTNETLYSADIIDYEGIAKYACNYGSATSEYNQRIDNVVPALYHYYAKETLDGLKDGVSDVTRIVEKQREKHPKDILCEWIKMSQWNKESNQSARLFMKAFHAKKYRFPTDPQETVRQMLTEHQRWMRLHFANGWITGPRDKARKVHNCLTAYEIVEPDTYKYDLVNVLWTDKSSAAENSSKRKNRKTEKTTKGPLGTPSRLIDILRYLLNKHHSVARISEEPHTVLHYEPPLPSVFHIPTLYVTMLLKMTLQYTTDEECFSKKSESHINTH